MTVDITLNCDKFDKVVCGCETQYKYKFLVMRWTNWGDILVRCLTLILNQNYKSGLETQRKKLLK